MVSRARHRSDLSWLYCRSTATQACAARARVCGPKPDPFSVFSPTGAVGRRTCQPDACTARGGEGGQAAVLILGMLLVVLGVGGLVLDGSRAILLRRSLQNALDSAVLAGAEQVSVAVWQSSGGTRMELDRTLALRAASEMFSTLAPSGASAHFEVRGSTVRGRGRARAGFFLFSLVGIPSYEVEAEASASPAFVAAR